MKKYLFLGVSFLFAGLLFWKISFFDFSLFHFYGLIDKIFTVFIDSPKNYLVQYLPTILLLGVYTISLIYVALFYEKRFILIFPLILAEILLYSLLPKISFIFIGLAFAVGSFMLIVQVVKQNEETIKLNFFDLAYKGINHFVRYALIILCLYNFVLIKNQAFVIPESVFNATGRYLKQSVLDKNLFNEFNTQKDSIDFNQNLCTQLNLDQTTCLTQINTLMQTRDLDQLTQNLGYQSPTELNLSEIINLKTQTILEPYQYYLPYFFTVVFFSFLYFILTFLVFIYAFLAVIIQFLLLKIKLVTIDIKEVPQEILI